MQQTAQEEKPIIKFLAVKRTVMFTGTLLGRTRRSSSMPLPLKLKLQQGSET